MTVETMGPAAEIAMLDATGQAELVRRGEVTPLELVDWAIERIERSWSFTPFYDPEVFSPV